MSLKCRLRGRSHGDDGQKAADRIEELEKQVRELQGELAQMKTVAELWKTKFMAHSRELARYKSGIERMMGAKGSIEVYKILNELETGGESRMNATEPNKAASAQSSTNGATSTEGLGIAHRKCKCGAELYPHELHFMRCDKCNEEFFYGTNAVYTQRSD